MRHLWSVIFLASCVLQPHDDPGPPAPASTKRVFVTRGTYSGALTSYLDAPDGLEAADRICELRAKAATLGGTWVAWLSSSQRDAIERVTDLGPWQMLDGQVAFASRAQLYGEPLVPLEYDERGMLLDDYSLPNVVVWTGTRAGGLRHPDTCNDWTTTTGDGHYGARSASFGWTDDSSERCSSEHRLVCLEI
jgi:hypothetical protein